MSATDKKIDELIEQVATLTRVVRKIERQSARVPRIETRLCALSCGLGIDVTNAPEEWEDLGVKFHIARTRDYRNKYKEQHAND